MSPFDPRSALFAKHAQHVVLIHFPIALFLVAVTLDILALRLRKEAWQEVVYCNLTIAALFTIPALLTGVAAWQWQLEGHHLKGILLLHLLGALLSSVMIWVSWWMHRRRGRGAAAGSVGLRLAVELLGVLSITVTGHLGGFLSGVNS